MSGTPLFAPSENGGHLLRGVREYSIRVALALIAGGTLLTGGLLGLQLIVVPAAASTKKIVVNPGRLQAALNSANPGDRVLLKPGTYPESITVRRGGQPGTPITITPASATTIPVLTGPWVIRAPYVAVRRLVFDGSGYNDYPIWAASAGDGVYASHFTLENCEVRDARLSGIFVGDTSPPMPVQNVTIRACHLHDNGDSASQDHGIYIKSGSNHLIEGNLIIRSSGFGIQNYPHAQGVVIRGNEIRQNGAGILIEHGFGDQLPIVNNTRVVANYVKDNRSMGISLKYGEVSFVPPEIVNTVSSNWAAGNVGGQYGSDGTLGNSDYTRGAIWPGNVYGGPAGHVLAPRTSVGPRAPRVMPTRVAAATSKRSFAPSEPLVVTGHVFPDYQSQAARTAVLQLKGNRGWGPVRRVHIRFDGSFKVTVRLRKDRSSRRVYLRVVVPSLGRSKPFSIRIRR